MLIFSLNESILDHIETIKKPASAATPTGFIINRLNENQPMTANTLPHAHLNAQRVMLDAWRIARKAAKRYGYPAKDFIAHALRQAWARLKALQVCSQLPESNAQAHAVYTVCVDEILNRSVKLRDQLAVELYFTDLTAALTAKAVLAKAFIKPFIKTAKPCFA